jgi:transposase
MSTVYLGVDVCKATLEVDLEGCPQVKNSKGGIGKLLRMVRKSDRTVHVVCEATGGYEKPLVEACHLASIPVSIVNPKRVRDYARAAGVNAKTDAIDKRMISRYAQAFPPRPTLQCCKTSAALLELTDRRLQIRQQIAQTRQATAGMTLAVVVKGTRKIVRAMEAQLAEIEAEIRDLIDRDAQIREMVVSLTSQLVGVAELTAVTLLATMPELGRLNRREIAALAGLAPFNRDSGLKSGKRFIRAGRSKTRRALYMPALVASTHCPRMRATYQGMIGRGKPPKVALTAVMRKMLVAANSIIRQCNESPKCSLTACG